MSAPPKLPAPQFPLPIIGLAKTSLDASTTHIVVDYDVLTAAGFLGGGYGPASPDGSDREGDFWSLTGNVIGNRNEIIWLDSLPPNLNFYQISEEYVYPAAILQFFIKTGVLTEEQVTGARATLKLKGANRG